ncbi:MAG: ABC transporter ATP-binding protein [Acidobacteria bacterium]|uniref:ABC transporter ATP-binding protein n=1 Tax=Candidatus Polarisedimenticola svalbardensis TaxID=2886004 RepID=A0A8J7CDU9_9BACT|nr:ABC transporter ATP-binding protein [Candidatus Polarisedimenticola svalbardensis]
MGHAVEARRLEKRFTRKRSIRELLFQPFRKAEVVEALRGVDLTIREGEIFGLLGPNGAGKTTLLKILSCLVLPDEGSATIGGHPTSREQEVKPLIGLVHSDERSFYWRLSGRQNMNFFSTLYEVPRERRDGRIAELLQKVDMDDAADRPFADYSSGMKQRMSIARAMLHDPPILLMDEPTRSLDPAAALSLRRFIQDELSGRDRKTIVLATHNLHEAELLCSRIAVLMKGKVRQVGTVEEVRRWGLDTRNYELELDRWPAEAGGRFNVLSDRAWEDGRRIRIGLSGDDGLNPMLAYLLEQGVTIRGCTQVDADLEGAFARILEAE